MYTGTHGNIGAIIYSACPNKIIGGSLAFLSHYLLDYIGEEYYGNKKIELIIEFHFFITFIILALISNDTSSYFIGWILGNLNDLIDKRMFLNKSAKQYFSCHGFPGWNIFGVRIGLFSINNWKLGYPVKIKLNKKTTITLGILTSIILGLFTYFI